ncbi:MAG: hypothetical protein QOI13_2073 [Paraburkholderia sp.]|nr:hypothetical protein [Paraburkholderia sp.]
MEFEVKDIDQSAIVDVDLGQKRVTVASDATPDELLHAISEAGCVWADRV